MVRLHLYIKLNPVIFWGDSNVYAVITRLTWTIWTSLSGVTRKTIKFNHSLTPSFKCYCGFWGHETPFVIMSKSHWPELLLLWHIFGSGATLPWVIISKVSFSTWYQRFSLEWVKCIMVHLWPDHHVLMCIIKATIFDNLFYTLRVGDNFNFVILIF